MKTFPRTGRKLGLTTSERGEAQFSVAEASVRNFRSHTVSAPAPCICCGLPLSPSGGKNGYRLWHCAECSFLSTYPLPTPTDLQDLYNRSYFFGASHNEGQDHRGYSNVLSRGAVRAGREVAKLRLDLIGELMGRIGLLLDVGCAAGTFLGVASEQGWRTTGVELNPEMRERARVHCSRGKVAGTLAEVQGRFDAITMWEYLEHVPDPPSEIERVRGLLQIGGIVCMSFPNLESQRSMEAAIGWEQVKPPEHLHYWNAANISAFLERHGFVVEGFRFHGHRAALGGIRVLGSRSKRRTPFWPLMSVFMRTLGNRMHTGFAHDFPLRTRQTYEGMEVYARLR